MKITNFSQQACDGFSHQTLIGNWHEERLAKQQPFRDNSLKRPRESDNSIALIGDNHQLLPLRRLSRNEPWNTKENIRNDNFNETRTTNQTFYDKKILTNYLDSGDCRNIVKTTETKRDMPEVNKNTMFTNVNNHYHLISRHNTRQAERERPAKQQVGPFGSVLPKHPEQEGKFHGLTSYQGFYSRPLRETTAELIQVSQKQQAQPAGISITEKDRPATMQRKRLMSVQVDKDPKQNTEHQRQWVQTRNTSLQRGQENVARDRSRNLSLGVTGHVTLPLATYLKNNDQAQQIDNGASLPIGGGEFSEARRRSHTPGEFRRIRSDITRVMNTSLSKR